MSGIKEITKYSKKYEKGIMAYGTRTKKSKPKTVIMVAVGKLKPKKMILTNLHSDLDYDTLLNILAKNIFSKILLATAN